MNLKKTCILFIALLGVIFMGCSNKATIIPEDIINNAIKQDEKETSYYAEMTMESYMNNKKEAPLTLKKWYDSKNNKIKTEVISKNEHGLSLFDGKKMITYDVVNKSAFYTEDQAFNDEVSDNNQKGSRNELINTLEHIHDTHKIEFVAEEKVGNFATYHIKATPNTEKAMIGETEFWINKDNWFIVKSISNLGDMKAITTYTKLDMNPKFKEDTFKLDIPKDVEVKNLADFSIQDEEIKLSDAKDIIGKAILYYPNNDLKLEKVLEEKQSEDVKIVTQEYNKADLKLFSLIVSTYVEEKKDPEVDKMMGYKDIEVRNKSGRYVDKKGFRIVEWVENNLSYSVLINDQDISIKDVIQMIDKMKLYK